MSKTLLNELPLENLTIEQLETIQERGWDARRELEKREKPFKWCFENSKSQKIKIKDGFLNFTFVIKSEVHRFFVRLDQINKMPF